MKVQIPLRKIVEGIPKRSFTGTLDLPITDIQYDPRKVTPGSVFFALPGSPRDGHDCITTALERGAAAVIYERPIFQPPRVTSLRVPDSRKALAAAAEIFYGHPARHLTLVGATGGEARSSAAYLTRHLLQNAGIQTGLVGSIAQEYEDRMIPAFGVIPEALETQYLMAEMVRTGCKACVLDVPPQNGFQLNGDITHCDIAVYTHGNGKTNGMLPHKNAGIPLSHVLAAKNADNRFLGTVHDLDDPSTLPRSNGTGSRCAVTYGADRTATVQVHDCCLLPDGGRLRLGLPGGVLDFRVPFLHRDDLRALLAAVGVAVVWGVPMTDLSRALERLSAVPGRLESVDNGQPFRVFVDSARTGAALGKALAVLRQTGTGRLIAVIGAGSALTLDERIELGEVAARLADHVIVTSNNPCCEAPEAIAEAVACGHCLVRSSRYRVQLDRRKAITEAVGMAQRGDTVLIAGKGHITYQEQAHTIVPFDDRVFARESLEEQGYCPDTEQADC